MSDPITARGSESKFKTHPDGQFVGQCVDTINLGEHVHTFAGDESYLEQRCVLVFRTGELNEETNEYIDLWREFTVSMSDKANLRKFLEQWRGKEYTPEQIEAGVPLDKLTGNSGLLTVAHRKSGKGKTYANITACVGIPKQMAGSVTNYPDYTRADFWATKKKEYADEVAKFKADTINGSEKNDIPATQTDEDDSLPF